MRRFGISRDSPWTHIAWQHVLELDFQLLSDFNAEATHGFDVGSRTAASATSLLGRPS